jgi:membrane fusion protein (multidrug efflux system)
MLKKLALTILGLLAVVAFLGGIKALQIMSMIAAGKSFQQPPEVVTSAEAHTEAWQPTLSAVGSFAAVQGVTVGAEMPGKVVQIAFESGATVAAGDLLVQLDTSTEQAQLRATEATAELARINVERARDLIGKQTISKAELDAAEAQFAQARAQADNIRAVIAKKTIRAPFAGRLGIRLVNLGQILKDGEAIVSLQALDPIYVNFSLPQQTLAQVAAGQTVSVTSDALPGETVSGVITAINPDVDATTRNVRLQATLANPKGAMRPGMFANVAVALPQKNEVVAIPVTAVLYATFGDSVFVIEDDKEGKGKVLRQQFVRLGQKRGDFVAVIDGLKPGQVVVSSGVFKLRNGAHVVIDNKLAPPASLAPKPANT